MAWAAKQTGIKIFCLHVDLKKEKKMKLVDDKVFLILLVFEAGRFTEA